MRNGNSARHLSVALLLAANLASAQSDPNTAKKKPPETPRDLARLLLDEAHDAVGRAQPGAQAALLARIGDCYILFDKKKALDLLEQAFSIASSLPDRAVLESSIVSSVSDLDLKKAAEMARAMPPEFRSSAIETVVRKLVDHGKIDDAIELVNLGSGTRYPFSAMAAILTSLNDDDPRRVILFGGALSGFQASPDRQFGQLVAANWEHLPRSTVQQALDAIVTKVATYKEDSTIFRISISGAKGSADLNTEQEIELFDVLAPLEALEPGKLRDLYEAYPSLKKAHDLFPEGPYSAGTAANYTGVMAKSGQDKVRVDQDVALFNKSMMLKQQAEALAHDDLAAAMEKVDAVPLPLYRATTEMAIAEQKTESDPAAARDLLNKALAILAKCDVAPYGDGVAQASVTASEQAHKLGDDELTRRALNLAFDVAAKFAKWDMDPDDPNDFPEDMWPSTFSYQNAMGAAERIFGMGAVVYLDRVQNADMYLFSQVALAAALLERRQSSSHGSHPRPKSS